MDRVDGNAVAGVLGEVFAVEWTEVRGRCDTCGAIAVLGSAHAYAHALAPGSVVRCASCEAVLAVIVQAPGRTRLAFRGLTWIDVSVA